MPASAAPVLRAVQAADAAVLAALHAQAMDEAWSAATFAGLLAVPGSFGLLAMGAGDPAGFALARVAADEAEILALAVVPAWRCRGVGAALVDATAAAARGRGARRLFLEVSAENAAGRALYRRCGFVAVGTRAAYYARPGAAAADALVLALALDSAQDRNA
jgi:ribosomal-protein-alanine N-acetyltransferase